MGLTHFSTEFLMQARRQGIRFGRTLTLGHQSMFVSPIKLARMLKRYGAFPTGMTDEAFYRGQFSSPYVADELIRILGASEVVSMDFVAYEGANIEHDLNLPISDSLKKQFDTVIDGGTLEHVFNFPVAIRNCMEMVKVGGTIFIGTPANNHFGHGFYQFSAELFYRVFSEANGFRVDRMHVAESEIFGTRLRGRPVAVEYLGRPYFQWPILPEVKQRVLLLATRMPVYMLVQATRVADKPIFAQTPQQSDYQAMWAGTEQASPIGGQLQYSPRWANLKHLQLYWLPKLCRLNPFFYWRALRARSLKSPHFRRVFQPPGT